MDNETKQFLVELFDAKFAEQNAMFDAKFAELTFDVTQVVGEILEVMGKKSTANEKEQTKKLKIKLRYYN